MKYKVGDTVRVKNNLEIGVPHGKFRVTNEMGEYRGHWSKITEARHGIHGYKLEVDDGHWSWSETMLEPFTDDRGLPIFETDQPDPIYPLSIHDTFVHGTYKTDNGLPHTPHYMNGLIETIDVIKMALTEDEFRGFLKGNVLKYELRAPYKHAEPDEDYQKAKDYYDLLEGLQ